MFTIYTFGDPELLREALLALATVFGLSEWWDASSGFGAGGNLLAAALIGLLAVAIAGITSQQIRLDYLLVALILFGVAFGSKTDVQVEDIQSGTSFVVADVPIGIAAVAGAASSAARNLTETMGVALQRPGTNTSLLTSSGFLDPLRTLMALRSVSFQELDPHLTRSMLEYYRSCIGHTMEWAPGTFDQAIFTRSGDPVSYMLNPANVLNWSTVYFSAANPGGQNQTCHDASANIAADIGTLTDAASMEALAKLRLSMGTKTFDSAFEFTDLEDAIDVTTRGIYTGQQFMTNALMRNFHNIGEAWRLAEYGTNQAKYAIEVTGALEQQRVGAAVQGTVFLNMMFPMMTFFQFIFISLAPFIALILVASPFTSAKTLGGYALFGVWSYSWMPIAAVINHYIQINIGNIFEYSDVASAGFSYLSIVGIDDFYNQLANKITIGANALAAAPAIIGAVLFLSFQGLTSLGGKLAQAKAPTKVSSNVSSPTQAVTNPYAVAGGGAGYESGTRPVPGGLITGKDMRLQIAGGNLVGGQTTSLGRAAAESRVQSARNSLADSTQRARQLVEEASRSGIVGESRIAGIETKTAEAAMSALSGTVSQRELQTMNYEQLTALDTSMGVGFRGLFGVTRQNQNKTGNQDAFQRAMDYVNRNEGSVRAEMAETLAEKFQNDTQTGGAFRETGSELRAGMEQLEAAESLQRDVSRQAQAVQQIGLSTAGSSASDVFRHLLATNNAGEMMNRVDSTLAGEFGSDYGGFIDDVREQYRRTGRSMSGFQNDALGRLVATNLALNNAAQQDPRAMRAMLGVYNELGIGGVGQVPDGSEINLGGVEGSFRGFNEELESRTSSVGGPGAVSTRTRAGDNLAAASTMPGIPERSRSDARQRQAGNVSANNDRDVASINPSLGRQYSQDSARFDGATGSESNAGSGLTNAVQGFMLPKAGFDRSLNALGEALDPSLSSNERSMQANYALGALQREVRDAGGDRGMVMGLYEGYRSQGLSETESAAAVFATVGPRKEGGEGYFVQAVMGAAGVQGYRAAEKLTGKSNPSNLRLLRAGGVAAVATIVVAAVQTNRQINANYQAGIDGVRELIKTEFAAANTSDAPRIEAFNSRMDQARTGDDMVAIIQDRQFDLSEDQYAMIEQPRGRGTAPSVGSPGIDVGRWDRPW